MDALTDSTPKCTVLAPHDKIKTVDELAEIVADHKMDGEAVVHCHGVFDLLHPDICSICRLPDSTEIGLW